MTKPLVIAALGAYAIIMAAAVIATAGYYESLPLAVGQLLAITVPTFVPLALALIIARPAWLVWSVAVLLPLAGWARTVWIDTQPYLGGGASFAILMGWGACALAVTLLLTAGALRRAKARAIPAEWRAPPRR